MTPTTYRYRIQTLGGEKAEIDAGSAAEALSKLGLTPDQIRPWYPMALAVVLPPEEQAERDRKKAERFAALAELNRQRRELRHGNKKQGGENEKHRNSNTVGNAADNRVSSKNG